MAAFDVIVVWAGAGAFFLAVVLIGREILKKMKNENEIFERNHVEDAMRIKAKQYESKY